MLGLMQQHSLLISSVIEFAGTYHSDTEIVSKRVEGDIHRTNYAAVNRRAKQIANALDAMQIAQSSRVATLVRKSLTSELIVVFCSSAMSRTFTSTSSSILSVMFFMLHSLCGTVYVVNPSSALRP